MIINKSHLCKLCYHKKVLDNYRKLISEERYIRILIKCSYFFYFRASNDLQCLEKDLKVTTFELSRLCYLKSKIPTAWGLKIARTRPLNRFSHVFWGNFRTGLTHAIISRLLQKPDLELALKSKPWIANIFLTDQIIEFEDYDLRNFRIRQNRSAHLITTWPKFWILRFVNLISSHTPVAQKVGDEVLFRRFRGEGVEFF